MSYPDPLAALIDYLKADPDIATLTGGKVFGVQIPAASATVMPAMAVIVSKSGGIGSQSYSQLYYQRVDVRTFGASASEASQVHVAVMRALIALQRQERKLAIIYRIAQITAPAQLVEPDTNWPFELSTWELASHL